MPLHLNASSPGFPGSLAQTSLHTSVSPFCAPSASAGGAPSCWTYTPCTSQILLHLRKHLLPGMLSCLLLTDDSVILQDPGKHFLSQEAFPDPLCPPPPQQESSLPSLNCQSIFLATSLRALQVSSRAFQLCVQRSQLHLYFMLLTLKTESMKDQIGPTQHPAWKPEAGSPSAPPPYCSPRMGPGGGFFWQAVTQIPPLSSWLLSRPPT